MDAQRLSGSAVHLSGYQARDHEIVDYRMYELGETGLAFRGPAPGRLTPGGYFAAIGAAQTFGCFCPAPFPNLLARELGLPGLNLGYGGAGPEFFLRQDSLLPWLNNARFVIVQIMSGRSQSNGYYQCDGLEYVTLNATGERMGAAEAWDRLIRGRALPGGRYGRRVARLLALPRVRGHVAAARAAWGASMLALLARIEVPVVLLWFSRRSPEYREGYGSSRRLFGEFPHLINETMLAPLRRHASAYVECVSDRGSPQPLISRFTGQPVTVNTANDRPDLASKPWAVNHYYPSPEMHADAAAALRARCRRLM